MIEIKRILCPVDFSESAHHALTHAAALASWYGARLDVLHVYGIGMPPAALAPGMGLMGGEAVMMAAVDEARLLRDLERFAADAVPAGTAVDCRVTDGGTVAAIIEASRAGAADLIVLGTHGRSGFERLLLGSTTTKVLRTAPCSVLTVPPASAIPAAPRLFDRILAATDFSDASAHALQHALSLAQEANAHLTVVHVVEMPATTGEWIATRSDEMSSLARAIVDDARRRLTAVIPAPARDWCEIVERLEIGRPYKEILRIATADGAGLIVLGVHGHGVFDRLFFGSTAEHVVRQAPCPVLTVRL